MPSRISTSRREAAPPRQKRPRSALDDNAAPSDRDMEVVDVVEASSSFRNSARTKRVRISDAKEIVEREPSTPGIDTPAPGDPDDGADNSDDPELGPSQYEMMRDMDFGHLLHEEDDDMVATQRLQQRTMRNASMAVDTSGENRMAVNGIIERVTCVNFMCHTRLECELGPLLNFIVGENGSGKSAILTAITLCLGAKASSTNRGGSLKNFVKQGEERGFLAVQIKNCGEDAYQHDQYGDSIIVERHFSKTGTSSFKVKSAAGRIVSTKRADVDDIVEYYYLHVDNPLNVLSQDNARQFLNSASAAQKYKFFIQGVQLEQLDKDYELVKQYLDAHNERIPILEERVEQLKKNLDEAKKVHEVIQGNREMRRKKREYLNQLAWSQVAEQERILETCDKAVAEARASIADAEQLTVVAGQKLELENDKLSRAKEALVKHQADEDSNKDNVERAAEAHKAAELELRSLLADERDIHSRLRSSADRVKDLEEKICNEEQRLKDADGDQHREKMNQLEAEKKKYQQINDDIARETERLPGLEAEVVAADAETRRAIAAVARKRDEVKKQEEQVHNLRRSGGSASPYAGFDPRMPELVRLIEQDGRFAQKPIGPLGARIRVQKPVWGPILERTLGASLSGFIVTSTGDQQRLSGLAKRLGMNNVMVLIANNQRINTEGREPDAQFDTVLRILEFDDPLIRDQLIINYSIEQVILVKERKRAQQIMFNGPVPQNVTACLSLHDRKRGEGLRLTVRPGGNFSTAPVVPNFAQRPRMKTDVNSQIAVQEEVLAQSKDELRVLKTTLDEVQKKKDACLDNVKANSRRLAVLQTASRRTEVGIRQIEEELDAFDGADGRLELYRQDLELAKEQKEQFGGQYGDVNVRKKQQHKTVEERKRELETERTKQRDLDAKVEKTRRSVEKHEDLYRVALVAKNEAYETLAEKRTLEEVAVRKRDTQATVVEEFAGQATAVSAERVPIPAGETYASIEKKLDSLVKQLEKRRQNLGMTDEEASNRLVEARTAYSRMSEVCEVSKAHIEAITHALVKRLEKWRLFQRFISASSRTNFIYLLSERGYRGRLLIDHRAKRLRVQVEPDETRRTVSARDTRTLSGGEKSFSSICLLLAIWEAMGSPLRCLDEFDVFMDNVNRDVSTNMLIDTARRNVGRQYIFITPNAIQGNARYAPDVKIIRLTDPRQRTLDQMR